MYYSDPSSLLPHLESWPLAAQLSHDIEKLLYYKIPPKVTFGGRNDEKEGIVVTEGLLTFENSKFLFTEADTADMWRVDMTGFVEENKKLVEESNNVCRVTVLNNSSSVIKVKWEHITELRKSLRPAALACSWIGAL